MINWDRLRERLDGSLWFIPVVCAVGALILSNVTATVGDHISPRIMHSLVPGDIDTARGILTTISASMISVTGIVFTITIVALQLASQQFSPRILRTFLRDRVAQWALGTFVATFVYSLSVLRFLNARTGDEKELSVAVALTLVALSIGAFINYLDHMAKAIRVSHMIAGVGDETRATIERYLVNEPHEGTGTLPSGDAAAVVTADRPGIVVEIHHSKLARLLDEPDSKLVIVPALGDFVPHDGVLARIYGTWDGNDRDVRRWIDLETERTMDQDVAFGIRQLVDIAEKGLSPAVNDPTTAVQVIDQIHDILLRLAPLPDQPIRATV